MVHSIHQFGCQLQKPLKWGVNQFKSIHEKTDHIAVKALKLVAAVFAIVLGAIPYAIGSLFKYSSTNPNRTSEAIETDAAKKAKLAERAAHVLDANSHFFSKYKVFEGILVDGKISGRVEITYLLDDDLMNYIGHVVNDVLPEGDGMMSFTNGGFYNGSFKNGLMHGSGVLAKQNEVYEGQFLEGEMTGQGRLTGRDGNVLYEGQFLDGEFVNP